MNTHAEMTTETDEPQSWSIQEFADEFEVTPRTVRFYEAKGLLYPERQGVSRVFSQSDHIRLSEIMRAKRLGFSLEDIKIVMDVIDGKVTDKALLAEHKVNFEIVITSLRRRRKDVDTLSRDMTALCEQIDTYLNTETTPVAGFEFAEAYDEAFRRHFDNDGAHPVTSG